MPNFTGRDDSEEILMQQLARADALAQREIMSQLAQQDTPDPQAIPPQTWEAIEAQYAQAIQPTLEQTFVDAANEFTDDIGFGILGALLSEQALSWAAQYTRELSQGLTNTVRKRIISLGASFGDGFTLAQFRAGLARFFSPTRLIQIAATEITSAISAAESFIRLLLGQGGVRTVAVWNTQEDEKVCPICNPRNGRTEGDGWIAPPPAHPRCRCYLTYRVTRT